MFDLTMLLYTNIWFSIYCFHCIVTFKPKVILPDNSYVLGEYAGSSSLKGMLVFVWDTHGIVPDFVRALNECQNEMTWTQLETGDLLSEGTHKGSEGQADQGTHGEDPQRQRGRW
jgi:hypothetical protein